MYSQADDSY